MAAFTGDNVLAVGTFVVMGATDTARPVQAVAARDYGDGMRPTGWYVVSGQSVHHSSLEVVTCTNDMFCRIPRDLHADHS